MAHPVRKILLAFALCFVQVVATSSMAVPILWTLSGAGFDDGGTATGSFVYDAPSNTYSAIDITTTASPSFGGAAYHAVSPHFGAPSSNNVNVAPSAFLPDYTGVSAFLLSYSSALTDLGGTVGLGGLGTILEMMCNTANCSSASGLRELTSGSLVATAPVRFVLQGVTFDDGGTASGSFLYYPGTNKYGAIDITTTGGLGGAHYDHWELVGSNEIQLETSPSSSSSSSTWWLLVQYNQPLPSNDDPGFDSFIVGRESQCLDATCSTSSPLRDVTGGSVTSAEVPAPSSLMLGLLGALALFVARRRNERRLTA